jgi:hypothetical protein
LDQIFLLQVFERIDERGSADPQIPGKFFLGNFLAGPELSIGDHLFENQIDFLIQVLVRCAQISHKPALESVTEFATRPNWPRSYHKKAPVENDRPRP